MPRPSGHSFSIPLTCTRRENGIHYQEQIKFPDLEVLVPGHEEEVVVHKLLPDLLVHAGEGEVGAGKVSLQGEE